MGFLDSDDDADLVLGGRFRARLLTRSEDFPLDGALISRPSGPRSAGGRRSSPKAVSVEGLRRAADALRSAEVLIVTSGAGMGVDSGLPDFRGERGFWNAYPMYERLGLTFVEAANPAHFEEDPEFGWGFYGHRTHLYRDTEPHGGFGTLKRWIERFRLYHFVVTSNVDGQFQKAGFDERRILEIHGSIHHLQCLRPCSGAIWPNREEIPVHPGTMRAARVPRCIRCGGVARPNVLMFGYFSWIGDRTGRQESRCACCASLRLGLRVGLLVQ